jgi:hypothetical protein
MGEVCPPSTIRQTVYDRCNLISAAIHSLLSSTGIFKWGMRRFWTHGFQQRRKRIPGTIPDFPPCSSRSWSDHSPATPTPAEESPSIAEHIANYLEYFQSELCSGHTYSTNEHVILILSRLHPTWRDALKRKYTTLVPQNGAIPPIPMECQLAMLIVTLTQWCVEERTELPSAKVIGPSSSVFALLDSPPMADETVTNFADMQLNSSPPSILFGHTSIDTGTVDRVIQHIVCYFDRGSQKGSYPECIACGLPGQNMDKCHPLVNFCLSQALAAQHLDIVKHIKAAYAQFPR